MLKIEKEVSELLELEKHEFSQKNDYYLPEFSKKLSKLCREFPCWTMVMNKYFNNPLSPASSARSEAYFSDFKSSINKVARVDKVLVEHCRAIESDCNLARSAIQNLKPDDYTTRKLNSELNETEDNYLYEVDRWRKKACPIEKKIPFEEEVNKTTYAPICEENLDSLFANDFFENVESVDMTDLDEVAEKKRMK